jgi:hypothetical protein
MNSFYGKFQGGSGGGYSRVHVHCIEPNQPLSIEIILDEDGWNEQFREGRLKLLQDAAIYGLTFAFDQAGVSKGAWVIHRIVAELVDTNPTIMAVAAARAGWKAVSTPPPKELDDHLQALVLDNGLGLDPPDFHSSI